jgi:hypothetical protein
MYKLTKNLRTNEVDSIIKEKDGVFLAIPFDPANTDYQAYLKWLEAGNTPTPADEGTQ